MATRDVLAEIRRAGRPHGVVTDDALRLTARQRQIACHNGLLTRRHPGVYIDPARPRTPLQELAAAVAAGGRLAAAWGRSSGALWGVIPEHPPTPEIVVPRRRHARVAGAAVHRSSALTQDCTMIRSGILTVKPLLTAIDLGVVLSPMEVAEVLIRARQLKLFEPDAVRAEIARITRPGRTGIRNARAALELVMIGDRPADSVLELRFHHGPGRMLPPYEYQWPVEVRGHKFRIDFAYPSVKVAIEVQGYETRVTRAAFDDEALRTRLLAVDGWTVVPCTWTHVQFDPMTVASDVLATLGAANYVFRG
ncbi:MAG TPA: hypothetical protein VFV00_15765 [Acidimicrobiales bacterium]|nr:hypothetical protein [Acidimicrobiales bacterium]